MKTLLIAFALLLATVNVQAEEIRAGWIAGDLHKSCMGRDGATDAFCECAVNKVYDADYTDKQLQLFLDGSKDNSDNKLVWEIGEYFWPGLKNTCSQDEVGIRAEMYRVCGKTVDLLFDDSAEKTCNCRADVGMQSESLAVLYGYFSGSPDENDPDRQKLIAMLEGNNASVNAQCGG
ncbi:MAG: hypothetical protein HWE30_18645 [Methylocystaceae bacterium]|nr:hypothetical protein [Methylocystaceae bacterium]